MAETKDDAPEGETLSSKDPVDSRYHDDDLVVQIEDDIPHGVTHGVPIRKPRPKPMPKRRFVED